MNGFNKQTETKVPKEEEQNTEVERLLNAFRRIVVRDGREEEHMNEVERLLKKINNKLWALVICVVVPPIVAIIFAIITIANILSKFGNDQSMWR